MPASVPAVFESSLELALSHASAPYRAETLGKDRFLQELRDRACRVSELRIPSTRQLLRRFHDNKKQLTRVCHQLSRLNQLHQAMPSGSEWLLDNQYIIDAVAQEIETDLPRGYYRKLPSIHEGHLRGFPRIYEWAIALLAHADSSLNEAVIRETVQHYQQTTSLTIGELWALPTMLRLALLENLRRLADRVLCQVKESQAAHQAIQAALSNRVPTLPESPTGTYATVMWEELRENDLPVGPASRKIQAWSLAHLQDIAHIQHAEFCLQAADQVSIGNAITSLRLLSVIDWRSLVESISLVEHTLRQDMIYVQQDFTTRDQCRREIENLSRQSKRTEQWIADTAAFLAQENQGLKAQVTYWLLDDGLDVLRSQACPKRQWFGMADWFRHHPSFVYFGSIIGLTLAGLALLASELALLLLLCVIIPCAILLSEVAVVLTNKLIATLVPPRVLPRLEWKKGVAPEAATFVVIPCMVCTKEHASELVSRLEQHYLANPDPQLWFALLSDYADASTKITDQDAELLSTIQDGIERLNSRYADQEHPRFFVFHRERLWNPSENCWMGWERKRGKIDEFNRLLRGGNDTSFTVHSHRLNNLPRIRFVLTLDADTVLPRDAARQMISILAHPLNGAQLDKDRRRVIRGYGVLQPRVSFLYQTSFRSLFARWFAGSRGIDPYSTAASDTYMDLFGRASYTGKGLYEVDAFAQTAGQAFPENRILSHDLIESNFARCALASNIELYDEFPAHYLSYSWREHRWIRGDWQLLPWLRNSIPSPRGYLPNILPGLERWKIVDNLRRSLLAPFALLLILVSWFLPLNQAWLLWLIALLPYLLPTVLLSVNNLLASTQTDHMINSLLARGSEWANTLGQAVLLIVTLPHLASMAIDAIGGTIYRLIVSHRKLLEWQPSAALEQQQKKTLGKTARAMLPGLLFVLIVAGASFSFGAATAPIAITVLIWMIAPFFVHSVCSPLVVRSKPLTAIEQKYLEKVAQKTWQFFETFVGADDHWLPPDNYQEEPCRRVAHRTSPTNIGVYLLSTLAAFHLKLITLDAMLERLRYSLDTLETLPRHQGHFLNWYDTQSLTTLRPEYVSTVDSGNLFACLLAIKNGLLACSETLELGDDRSKLIRLAGRCERLAHDMDFRFLYNTERDLFSIGYNVDNHRLDPNHYDLLASEACIASFLAIAYGQAPRKHWFQLGRIFTQIGHRTGLISWGGTMFEYLMPKLLLPTVSGVLLDQAQQTAVERQIDYANELRLPWGISESAYYAFDDAQQYQYQSFGSPHLGLKRGLSRDRVIAPYATLLAIDTVPHEAIKNLIRIGKEGGEGPYGFYEALDYTPNRLPAGKSVAIIRAYMAHHQGMGLLAIANQLKQGVIRRWLRAEPAVRSAELLLQERISYDVPLVEAESDDIATVEQASINSLAQSRRRIVTADTPAPRTHLLSNGRYSVMVTSTGTGYSRYEALDVTRWRADPTCDRLGTFFYLRDRRENTGWSVTHQPIVKHADEFEVIFAVDKADFHRLDGDLDTLMEVTVVPDVDVELRKITIANLGLRSRHLDITSYAEIVLATEAEDQAHPAFGKLFLETEWLPQFSALLCHRRLRSPEQAERWAVHVLAIEDCPGSLSYETDRAKFLGRRRDVSSPLANEPENRLLSGTVGAVLDPIFSIRRSLKIKAGEKITLAFTTGYADSRDSALSLAERYHTIAAVHRGFELAWAHTRIELQHAHLQPDDVLLYQKLAGNLLYPIGSLRASSDVITANTLSQSGLWGHGISGDLPLAVIRLHGPSGIGHLKQMAQAHEFWRKKGLRSELLVLCETTGGYYDEVFTESVNQIRTMNMGDWLDQPAGIFVRKGGQISDAERTLLLTCARVIIDDRAGPIHLQGTMPLLAAGGQSVVRPVQRPKSKISRLKNTSINALPNGYGGFSADELEYVIHPNNGEKTPPLPWSNVVANPVGGFLITDSGGGFTWAGNSQLNRLTPWSNDPVSDSPGEIIYIQDAMTGATWNPTPLPIRDDGEITVSHGQGYTSFERTVNEIGHDLTMAMPQHDAVKISTLKLVNHGSRPIRLVIFYYLEWVLGTHRGITLPHIVTSFDDTSKRAILARNRYNPDFPEGISFAACDLEQLTWTANRAEFLGRHFGPADPAAIYMKSLSGQCGAGLDACAAFRGEVALKPGEEKTLVFLLGQAPHQHAVDDLINRYLPLTSSENAIHQMIDQWDYFEDRLQVHTPEPAFDFLMNHWLLYQALSCRIWGRSAFYQSGGAYGFRDQLQDVMALVYSRPELVRQHLLRAASRQFLEGDVQHWWHEPRGLGVRTRFSDDFLWLPFVVSHYVNVTQDHGVLDELISFLQGEPLAEGVQEHYGPATISETSASLYDHCLRSFQHGWKLGTHGLPLIGCGDWNDGMNHVGVEGKGESIWVAWFQICCLKQFAELAHRRGDEETTQQCHHHATLLAEAIEQHGYDGNWYLRAFFDDGSPLGSHQNDACQIDSIVQSWAVLCEAHPQRVQLAMDEVMKRLVHPEHHLVQLFDPPFDRSTMEPGYIKGYLPGIRENGGQYTHAACWIIQALARLGRNEEAWNLYKMINPIELTRDSHRVKSYRGEPYVIAADVYYHPQHQGRVGWTWYTGSAAWYYRIGLEEILGFTLRGNRLLIRPCIPAHWSSFRISYVFREKTTYEIEVHYHERGKARWKVDGVIQQDEWLQLIDDGIKHQVQLEPVSDRNENAA